MATKNATFTLDANETQSSVTSRARVTGTTVYGDQIYADEEITQSAYVPPTIVYLYIESATTYNATGETDVLSQSKRFDFEVEWSGVSASTLGTASTQGHTSEHSHIDGAMINAGSGTSGIGYLQVFLDGTSLGSIGTGYVINYLDVTGTSVNNETVRATLVLRIELQKVTLTFDFGDQGAPTTFNATYALCVNGNSVVSAGGRQTVTYVAYDQYNITVTASVTTTTQFDPQTFNVNVLSDPDTLVPNNGDVQLYVAGYGPVTSTTFTTRFMRSGTVDVSFNWHETYVYSLTTTQAGCTVVMCGVTMTSSSTAGQSYTLSSVENSISYSVSKTGYYTESGTIYGGNPTISVTLTEVVSTTETVNLTSFSVTVQNRKSSAAIVSQITITLDSGGKGQWLWYGTGEQIESNNSYTFTVPVTGQSSVQITTNSIVTFEISVLGTDVGTSGSFECYEFDATSPSSGGSLSGSNSVNGGSTSLDRIQRVASGHTYPAGSNAIIVVIQ